MGSTGCLWGDYVYSDFSYRSNTQDENGDPISPNGLPESDVTVTLSNGGGDPANPVVSLTGNWSAADCNQMGIWVEYTVTAPSTGGIIGAGVSITGTVSNVDPDNQFSSYIDDAGAVGIDTGAYLPAERLPDA